MIHRNIELFNEDQISSFIKDHSCGPKNENKSIPRVCCPLQTDDIGENSKSKSQKISTSLNKFV